MRLDKDVDVEVAVAAAIAARFAGTRQADARPLVDALRDIDRDLRRLALAARAMAVLARRLDDLARAVAVLARLRAHHAAKGRVAHDLLLARAVAVRARLRARPRRGTSVFEADGEIVAQVIAALRARLTRMAGTGTAEEHVEDVVEAAFATAAEAAEAAEITKAAEAAGSSATEAARAVKGTGAKLVVLRAFLRVLQDIVGFIDLLELLLCLFRVVRIEVWMILAGQLLIGTLDLLFIRALVNAQHFIIIAFFAHVAPSLQKNWESRGNRVKRSP